MAKNPLLTATTADEMLKILDSENYEQAKLLHIWAESAGLKIEPRTGAHYYRIQYSTRKPKRSLFTIECNEKRWRVKSSLYNLAQYSDKEFISEPIKHSITATRTCTGCNERCIKGSRFTLGGENYFTCIGSGHFFENLNEQDWSLYLKLLQHEKNILTTLE